MSLLSGRHSSHAERPPSSSAAERNIDGYFTSFG
jgi:hypothetical protein